MFLFTFVDTDHLSWLSMQNKVFSSCCNVCRSKHVASCKLLCLRSKPLQGIPDQFCISHIGAYCHHPHLVILPSRTAAISEAPE